MPILETIRNRSGLAITIVGGALILFVVSDLLQSNGYLLSGGTDSSVGQIAGENVDIKLFETKYREMEAMYKQRQEDPSKPVDASMQEMLREQSWQQIINEKVLEVEYANLGIQVTIDELKDMVQGQNIHPQILGAPIFQNQETGQFDPSLVTRFFQNLMQSGDENAKTQWAQFELAIRKEAETKKFNALVSKGVYATTLEAKARSKERTQAIDYNILALNPSNMPDTLVAENDNDLKSYFNKNSKKYAEKEDSRKLWFVLFDITPTADDSANVIRWINEKSADFAKSENDTLFVDLNSDIKFDTNALAISAFPESIQNELFNSPVGTVVGPVFENGSYKVYKVSGTKEGDAYNMRASHILFRVDNGDTAATLRKAQEVLGEIRRGADFGEKAAQYGTDGTASRGGDLGWFSEGQMVKEFNDYVAKGKKGDMAVVKTQFGIHIVKITENKTNKLVCAGVLARSMEPGDATVSQMYNQAGTFATRIMGGEEIDAVVTEMGLSKRIADYVRSADKSLGGINEAREVVRWAFNSKLNDVSDVLTVGDYKFVVAIVAGIREKGKSDFEGARERVLADYRKEKKLELLYAKAETALKENASATIEELAAKLETSATPVAYQTFESGNVAFVGIDNTFIGKLFGNPNVKDKITGPVKGDNAVYIYKLNSISEGENLSDYTSYKEELRVQKSQRLEFGILDVLKEMYDVKDNRYKFY